MLLDNVPKLGKVGDLIEVKEGYARNYLIPMGLSIFATAGQIRFHQERLEKAREKFDEELEELSKVAKTIDGIEFSVEKKATDDGKLFGSVAEKDIKKLLKEKKVDVKNISVNMSNVQKLIGKYSCVVDFGDEVEAKIILNIKKKEK